MDVLALKPRLLNSFQPAPKVSMGVLTLMALFIFYFYFQPLRSFMGVFTI